jgi:hypothetical protein
MAETSNQKFTCPGCRKQFRWTAQLAGRKVRCTGCQLKMRIPPDRGMLAEPLEALPPKEDAAAIYELEVPDGHPEAPRRQGSYENTGKCPNCNLELRSDAVLCLNCGFNLAEGKVIHTAISATPVPPPVESAPAESTARGKTPDVLATMGAPSAVAKAVETGEDEVDHRFTEYHLPLILIGGSVLLLLLNTFLLVDLSGPQQRLGIGWAQAAMVELMGAAITLIIQLPFFLIGLILVAKIFGSSFGNLLPALLKLTAIAMLVLAVGAIVDSLLDIVTGGFGGIGFWFSISIQFGVFFAASYKLLDMDPLECVALFLIVIFLPVFAAATVIGIVTSMLF